MLYEIITSGPSWIGPLLTYPTRRRNQAKKRSGERCRHLRVFCGFFAFYLLWLWWFPAIALRVHYFIIRFLSESWQYIQIDIGCGLHIHFRASWSMLGTQPIQKENVLRRFQISEVQRSQSAWGMRHRGIALYTYKVSYNIGGWYVHSNVF